MWHEFASVRDELQNRFSKENIYSNEGISIPKLSSDLEVDGVTYEGLEKSTRRKMMRVFSIARIYTSLKVSRASHSRNRCFHLVETHKSTVSVWSLCIFVNIYLGLYLQRKILNLI